MPLPDKAVHDEAFHDEEAQVPLHVYLGKVASLINLSTTQTLSRKSEKAVHDKAFHEEALQIGNHALLGSAMRANT